MGMRLWVATLSAVAFFLTYFVGGGAGVGIVSSDGGGTMQASSSIASLAGAAVIVIAYLTALTPMGVASIGPAAGAGRRAVAWFIDFSLSLTALASILTLIPLTATPSSLA